MAEIHCDTLDLNAKKNSLPEIRSHRVKVYIQHSAKQTKYLVPLVNLEEVKNLFDKVMDV